MGTADGVSDAVDRSELFGPGRPGSLGIRRGVRGGVVRRCSGNTQRTTLGGNNVRRCSVRAVWNAFVTVTGGVGFLLFAFLTH